MTEETKPKSENLFAVCDSTLSISLKQCCLNGLTEMENINKFNGLLDASIKFHQLTMSINAQEEKRQQFLAMQAKQVAANHTMTSVKAD